MGTGLCYVHMPDGVLPACLTSQARPLPTPMHRQHRARLWVPAQRLEAARKCFGTDEDLLLVEVPSGSACCASAGSGSSDGGAEGGEAAPAAAAAAADEVSDAAASVQQHRQQQHRQQQQQQQQQPPDDWGAAEAGPYVVYG